jgi:hypothetical protein
MEGYASKGADYTTSEPISSSAIDRLDAELERLAHTLDVLSGRLRPVSTVAGGAEIEQIRPSEDSRSPLDGRAIRLGELTSLLDRLIRDLDI